MKTLDIIIVSYNTRRDLQTCLESLHDSLPKIRNQITVVDNNSMDGSSHAVLSGWPLVHVIDAGDNIGFARANNLAIRQTSSDLILLLNSDTVVPSGAIDRLVEHLGQDNSVVAIGPRLVDSQGHPELSFGSMINPLNELIQKLKGKLLAKQTPILSSWVKQSLNRTKHPDWISGACLLVRRNHAEAVGLFDEQFFLYCEDVDFCASLRKHGKILFTPDVEIVHHGGRSGEIRPGETREIYRRSQLAFYAKHCPAWTPALRLYLRARGQLPSRLL